MKDNIENLKYQEAIDKMKEIVDDVPVCMFETALSIIPANVRPMAVQEVDDNGYFWFISRDDSNKNAGIQEDDRVHLIFSQPSKSTFMSVFGHAVILRDKQKIDELWDSTSDAWFENGKEDIHVTLIRVKPLEAYYWDTKSNRAITLLKIAAAAITGTSPNVGVEGKIEV